MPTITERLETTTALAEVDAGLLHDIVHGAEDAADVITEGGPVPPIAKVIKQAEDALILSAGLSTRVAMPAATADAGSVGEFAVDGNELAIYVASVGWMFFTGIQK